MNIKNVFSHFFETIFFSIFLLALFVCYWKNSYARFFPLFFGHDIRVNIKKTRFRTFLRRFFSQHFLHALFVCFWKNYFARFFTIFWSRFSCEYNNSVFALFRDDIFPNISSWQYSCFSGKIVSRFFFPIFWSRYKRVNIKNVISDFF